jgi:hypothetical protein
MFSFRSLFPGRRSRPRAEPPARRRPAIRPRLEGLEERLVPNSRFVVAGGADNVSSFTSLHAALTTNPAALAAGDVITIEAGSAPGVIHAADLTALPVASLTIQGDPAAPLASVPQFTLDQQAALSNLNLTLKNVNVGLTNSGVGASQQGEFLFQKGATITGSTITNISSAAISALVFLPAPGGNIVNTVADSSLIMASGTQATLVHVYARPGAGNQNVFSGNVFQETAKNNSTTTLFTYGSQGSGTVTDEVVNNVFTAAAGTHLDSLFLDFSSVTGLTVQGNTFSDPDPGVVGIYLDGPTTGQQGALVAQNVISLPGVFAGVGVAGIYVLGGAALATEDVVLKNNRVIASMGTSQGLGDAGIEIQLGSSQPSWLYVMAQGNDLENCRAGVSIDFGASGAAAQFTNIDLGGGTQGSLGGNDFRGDHAVDASGLYGAIVVRAGNSLPTVSMNIKAQGNIFTGIATNDVFVPPTYLPLVTADTGALPSQSTAAVAIAGAGVWRHDGAGWTQLTTANPSLLATDANGDVAAEIPGAGVWRHNGKGWAQLTPANASLLAMDASGDVAIEIPGAGVWRYTDSAGWAQLTVANASLLAMDANGDVAVEIAGAGVWRYQQGSGWAQLTPADASALAMGADGDVAVEIAGAGVWRYQAATAWQQLTVANAAALAMDANGDVAVEIQGAGIWRYTDSAGWAQLKVADAAAFAMDAQGDLFAQIGGAGLWEYSGAWQQLTPGNAVLLGAPPS